jgi:hypothetical protein
MTDRPVRETGEPTTESFMGETGVPRSAVAPGEADAIPSDPEALAEDIERTRERLGQTVEALTAKLDVPARARDKVSQVKDRIADKTGDVTGTINGVTGQVADKAGPLREQVTIQTARAARAVRQRPVPYAVAAGVVLLAGAWLTRALKRR